MSLADLLSHVRQIVIAHHEQALEPLRDRSEPARPREQGAGVGLGHMLRQPHQPPAPGGRVQPRGAVNSDQPCHHRTSRHRLQRAQYEPELAGRPIRPVVGSDAGRAHYLTQPPRYPGSRR